MLVAIGLVWIGWANGDNTLEILSIEMDNSTGMDDLNGLTGGTQGDWVTGTPYPIIDDASISSLYQISYYPTIMPSIY